MLKLFLTSNEWKYRLLRTIIQGVIGVFIANIDLIFSYWQIDPAMKTVIVALCMAILSPIMAELGNITEEIDNLELGPPYENEIYSNE